MNKWLVILLLSALVSCMNSSDDTNLPTDSSSSQFDVPPVVLPDASLPPPALPVVLPPGGGQVPISGKFFTVRQGAPTLNESVWTMQTPPKLDELVCAISVAVGTRITSLLWSVDTATPYSWVNLNFQLVRIGPAGQRTSFLVRQAFSDIDYVGSFQLFESAGAGSYVTEPGFTYELSITVITYGAYEAPPKFNGVKITYQ